LDAASFAGSQRSEALVFLKGGKGFQFAYFEEGLVAVPSHHSQPPTPNPPRVVVHVEKGRERQRFGVKVGGWGREKRRRHGTW